MCIFSNPPQNFSNFSCRTQHHHSRKCEGCCYTHPACLTRAVPHDPGYTQHHAPKLTTIKTTHKSTPKTLSRFLTAPGTVTNVTRARAVTRAHATPWLSRRYAALLPPAARAAATRPEPSELTSPACPRAPDPDELQVAEAGPGPALPGPTWADLSGHRRASTASCSSPR